MQPARSRRRQSRSQSDRWTAPEAEPYSSRIPFAEKALLAYLALALLLGGAGISYPLITATIEGLALILIAYAGWTRGAAALLSPSRAANWLLLAILLLPLLHLIPLPYQTWAALPGHDTAAAILGTAGLAGPARPLSLDPYLTLSSWLALLPAVAIFLLASRLPPIAQRRTIMVAIGVAVFSALLGAIQKASGGAGITVFFPSGHSPNGPGIFVDRNHQAAFMLMAMPLSAGIAAASQRGGAASRMAGLGLVLLLGAATVATTSRAGIALLPFAALTAVLILFPIRLSPLRIILPLAGLAILAVAALQSSGVRLVLDRFTGHDVRFDYWADTWIGIRQFWPLGAGIGTFQDIYASLENLNIVSQWLVYNAHNDYIELLLDGGIAAMILILAFLILIAFFAFRAIRIPQRSGEGAMKAAAFCSILIVLIFSTTEYPLRMFTIMGLFALLCAIVAAAPPRLGEETGASDDDEEGIRRRPRVGWVPGIVAAAIPVLLLVPVAKQGIGEHYLLTGRRAQALAFISGEWRASFALAADAMERGDIAMARRYALKAIEAAPMRSEPATSFALAAQRSGQADLAARMIAAIAPLGWRNPPAQLWMLESALAQGNAETAVLRADALLRQGSETAKLIPLLRRLSSDPRAGGLIADRLTADPPWRGAYLTGLGDLQPRDFAAHWAILEALRGTDRPATAEEITAFSRRLVADRRFADAARLWKTMAPSRPRLDSGSPFDWTSHDLPALTVSADQDVPGDIPPLALTAVGSVKGVAVDRIELLAPGRYTLSSKISPVGGGENLRWRISCEGGDADLATGTARNIPAQDHVATNLDFVVPISCGATRLSLWIDQDLPTETDYIAEAIKITR